MPFWGPSRNADGLNRWGAVNTGGGPVDPPIEEPTLTPLPPDGSFVGDITLTFAWWLTSRRRRDHLSRMLRSKAFQLSQSERRNRQKIRPT